MAEYVCLYSSFSTQVDLRHGPPPPLGYEPVLLWLPCRIRQDIYWFTGTAQRPICSGVLNLARQLSLDLAALGRSLACQLRAARCSGLILR